MRLYIYSVLVFISFSAVSASFDCHIKLSHAERYICDDTKLSILDDVMAEAYQGIYNNAADPSLVEKTQSLWLKKRNQVCDGNSDVCKTEYLKRINQLIHSDDYPTATASGDYTQGMTLPNLQDLDKKSLGDLQSNKEFKYTPWPRKLIYTFNDDEKSYIRTVAAQYFDNQLYIYFLTESEMAEFAVDDNALPMENVELKPEIYSAFLKNKLYEYNVSTKDLYLVNTFYSKYVPDRFILKNNKLTISYNTYAVDRPEHNYVFSYLLGSKGKVKSEKGRPSAINNHSFYFTDSTWRGDWVISYTYYGRLESYNYVTRNSVEIPDYISLHTDKFFFTDVNFHPSKPLAYISSWRRGGHIWEYNVVDNSADVIVPEGDSGGAAPLLINGRDYIVYFNDRHNIYLATRPEN